MKLIYILLLFLFIAGCQAEKTQWTEESEETSFQVEGVEAVARVYETLTIEKQDILSNMYYPASIVGRRSIKLIPQIEGYIQKVMVREGAHVKQGQTLFVMDQAIYKAELNIAKANVSAAKAEVENAQLNVDSKSKLREKNIISEFELRQAEIQLKQAEAQLEQTRAQQESAEINLSYTTIKSPSNGVVGRLPYRVGDYIGPTMTDSLTTIADTKEMNVYFSLTEHDVMDRVTKYGSMDKMLAAFPAIKLKLSNDMDYAEPGHIESISGVVDPKTGTLQVRAVFANPDDILISGGTGKLVIPNEYKSVIVIPKQSTYEILNTIYVYKIIGGMAKSQIVDVISVSDGQHYIVTSGLDEGDVIVAKGVSFIQEDMTIIAPGQGEP